jgi:hypothetical protein
VRIVVIVFLVFILGSLGSSLYFLYRDRGSGSTRMVKALTLRVGLSILLFVLLIAGFRLGLITGHV